MIRSKIKIFNNISIIILTIFLFINLTATTFALSDVTGMKTTTEIQKNKENLQRQCTTLTLDQCGKISKDCGVVNGKCVFIVTSCDSAYIMESCQTGPNCAWNSEKNTCSFSSKLNTKVAPRKTTGYNMYVKLPCQSGANCPSTATPAGYIARLYQFGLMIAGLAAFGSIIYGSLLYVLSAGNIGSQQDARDQITQAILGLALLFGAYLILYTINPNLVNLANPAMEPLDLSGIETTGDETGTAQKNQNPDPLCKIGAKEGITMEGGSISLSGPQGKKNLFEGGKFVCEVCKANARKDGNGKCECDTGYVQVQAGSCERPEGVTAPGLLPKTTGDNLQYNPPQPGSGVLK